MEGENISSFVTTKTSCIHRLYFLLSKIVELKNLFDLDLAGNCETNYIVDNIISQIAPRSNGEENLNDAKTIKKFVKYHHLLDDNVLRKKLKISEIDNLMFEENSILIIHLYKNNRCHQVLLFYPININQVYLLSIDFEQNNIMKPIVQNRESFKMGLSNIFVFDKVNYLNFYLTEKPINCFETIIVPDSLQSLLDLSYSNYENILFNKLLHYLQAYAGPILNEYYYILYRYGNLPTQFSCPIVRKTRVGVEPNDIVNVCSSQCGQTTTIITEIFEDPKTMLKQVDLKLLNDGDVYLLVINIKSLLNKGKLIAIEIPSNDIFCGHSFSLFKVGEKYYWMESFLGQYPLKIESYSSFQLTNKLSLLFSTLLGKKWTISEVNNFKKLFVGSLPQELKVYQKLDLFTENLKGAVKDNKVRYVAYERPTAEECIQRALEFVGKINNLNDKQIKRISDVYGSYNLNKILYTINNIKCTLIALFKFDNDIEDLLDDEQNFIDVCKYIGITYEGYQKKKKSNLMIAFNVQAS